MEQIYLVGVGDATLNPEHVVAVWVYTAGDVFLNVRADGMTFKQTYPVDYQEGVERDEEGVPTQAGAELMMDRMKEQTRYAHSHAEDIRGAMVRVLNRDN